MKTNNKLREALETLLNLAYEVQDANSEYGPKTSVPTQFVIDVAKSALAEPVKNCEVGTVEQQAKRFEEYCESEVCKRKRCKSRAKALCIEHCALEWAQKPYKVGGER